MLFLLLLLLSLPLFSITIALADLGGWLCRMIHLLLVVLVGVPFYDYCGRRVVVRVNGGTG